MRIDDVVSAIVIGLVVGTLGRLVIPGRQSIGILATWLIGFGAALLGSWASNALNVTNSSVAHFDWNSVNWHFHWSWAELGIQVAFAVVGILLAVLIGRSFGFDGDDRPRRRTRRASRV
jgi:uncharacterized membrane protein YeaQ/YmgE (transglycosylase-associated protein family)